MADDPEGPRGRRKGDPGALTRSTPSEDLWYCRRVRGRGNAGSARGGDPPVVTGADSRPSASPLQTAAAPPRRPLGGLGVPLGTRRGALGGRGIRGRSGGFFRTQPWLRGARDLPHPAASSVAGVVLAVVVIWAIIALATANSQPPLPSSHAVLVSVKPAASHSATGAGHVIWYRSGGLLVLVLDVQHLPPGSEVSALLVPQASCSGARPSGTRTVGQVRADRHGVARFNEEMLNVTNLKFDAWSIWVDAAGQGRAPAACGVITLSNGTLINS